MVYPIKIVIMYLVNRIRAKISINMLFISIEVTTCYLTLTPPSDPGQRHLPQENLLTTSVYFITVGFHRALLTFFMGHFSMNICTFIK